MNPDNVKRSVPTMREWLAHQRAQRREWLNNLRKAKR